LLRFIHQSELGLVKMRELVELKTSARFSHHGGNEGYRCFIVAYVNSGEGAIVMTNSDNSFELIQEIVRSIAKEYGWLDYPLN
jgi:hypothetical protein